MRHTISYFISLFVIFLTININLIYLNQGNLNDSILFFILTCNFQFIKLNLLVKLKYLQLFTLTWTKTNNPIQFNSESTISFRNLFNSIYIWKVNWIILPTSDLTSLLISINNQTHTNKANCLMSPDLNQTFVPSENYPDSKKWITISMIPR